MNIMIMTRTILFLFLSLCSTASLLMGQTTKHLWVLREPDSIVEYDSVTFAVKQKLTVPSWVSRNLEGLAANAKGQLLATPSSNPAVLPSDVNPDKGKLWFWNGQTGVLLDRGETIKTVSANQQEKQVEIRPQGLLSADGSVLYWFANEYHKVIAREGPSELERSVQTNFRAWHTDLGGGNRMPIAQFSFPPCKCETGVCSETCPEAVVFGPAGGLDDFFLVTHRTEGQIGSTLHASFLYRRNGDKWTTSKLPNMVEDLLDGARSGSLLVQALRDGGCCGWDNEGNDQTFLTRNGRDSVLFDERARYANPNYDVSFFTSNALLSPESSYIALTVTSSLQPGAELRLSAEGKANAEELTRIRKGISELPVVEILRLESVPAPVVRIPHAELVGWLNHSEILVIEAQTPVIYNVGGKAPRRALIKVPGASHVLLR